MNTWITAKCYSNNSKPRIISDDGAFPAPGDPYLDSYKCGPAGHKTFQQCYIKELCDTATSENKGMVHYEHFDSGLETQLQTGLSVSNYGGWDPESKVFIEWIKSYTNLHPLCTDLLPQNGWITRNDVTNEAKLRWKTPTSDNTVNLIGFGPMGAITAGARLDIESFIHALRVNRVNLTRVWNVDQWVALRDRQDPPPASAEGLTPFEGRWDNNRGSYNLSRINPVFLTRLRAFVQAAADHGVVVNLSLFDKHGLKNSNSDVTSQANCRGQWAGSPYNSLNNNSGYILDPEMDECACDSPTCYAHPTYQFVDPIASPVAADNHRLVEAVLREIGGIGNVIFELINEQREDRDWRLDGDLNGIRDGEQWQLGIASQVNDRLSQMVVRDAFNGVSGGTVLGGSPSDTGQTWSGQDSQYAVIQNTPEGAGTGLLMGRVVPDGSHSAMEGELPITTITETDVVEVGANLTYDDNNLELGFRGSSSGDGLYLHIRRTLNPSERQWALIRLQNYNQETVLASKLVQSPSPLTFDGHVRLSYWPQYGVVNVYVNSSFDPLLSYPANSEERGSLEFTNNPPAPTGLVIAIQKAFFRGWKWSGIYTSGAVDNFVAISHSVNSE